MAPRKPRSFQNSARAPEELAAAAAVAFKTDSKLAICSALERKHRSMWEWLVQASAKDKGQGNPESWDSPSADRCARIPPEPWRDQMDWHAGMSAQALKCCTPKLWLPAVCAHVQRHFCAGLQSERQTCDGHLPVPKLCQTTPEKPASLSLHGLNSNFKRNQPPNCALRDILEWGRTEHTIIWPIVTLHPFIYLKAFISTGLTVS